ncbi:uncharacterized protein LOC105836296 [Monomorium pharaonis]|uniref:uncharacterized protein LOC105836296 n=1 Tax=Monomorium pharaonis TaxID=307658 RepID=UPI00063FB8FC|nr:uncharacterized protein LOC105836296 [Monomorium pharaonis]
METEELYNINIFPLVTSPFAIQWSPDNQISIITEKGVHVLELIPSPMSPNPTLKFARSFIYSSDTLPACEFIDEMSSLIWNLGREEIYPLLMDDVITPKLDGITEKFPRIIKTAWSPKNLISPNQCVLAILNSAGAVELLHKVSNNWYSIWDVSSFRLKFVQEEIKASLNKNNLYKKTNDQYARIAESMKKLQACSITWSELFKIGDTSFAYFSVAYSSNEILIWKVPRISNFTESLQPTFVGVIDLIITSRVNVLYWITVDVNKHLIVVGCSDGKICGVKLIDKDNNLQIALVEKYTNPDRIAVNYLYIIPQDKTDIKILAVKGSFLLLLCVNLAGELKSKRQLCVQGYTITGVIPIVTQQFLITTQDSHIFIIDIQSNDLININIKSHLPKTCVQYLGLAHSPNKVIFVNIISPNAVYDHLVMREPTIMHIFTLRGATCYDPLTIINNSANLGSVWDCMEILRLKAVKAQDPCMVLCPIPKNLESLSLYKLQISMWMTVMTNVCTTKKPMSNMDHIKECNMKALPLIFLHSACMYLENSTKKYMLSEDEIFATFLLRQYLEIYQGNRKYMLTDEDTNNEDINRRVSKILNMITFYPNQIEKCNLCGEVINDTWHARSCPRGHKLSRCCTTLLQITLLDYRVCPMCGQIFHPCLEDMYEEPQCQFCDVPILCNSYNYDPKDLKLYGRNLSLPRVANITESSKDLESEDLFDKQRSNKWDTSHTYSVIVNDDVDESVKITEKWAEF